ncbi:MAG: hypothetical protein KIT18_01150 [Burkholderiales bacterium]|nr:hypothetical protein [Burkholderiales bacterium]
MNKAVVLNQVLVALLLATLLAYWRLFLPFFSGAPGILILVALTHLVLLIGAIIGLWRFRPWGYYLAYLLVPFSTVMLSISFVPFVPLAFPDNLRPLVLVIVNAAVLLLAVAAHLAYRRTLGGAARGA